MSSPYTRTLYSYSLLCISLNIFIEMHSVHCTVRVYEMPHICHTLDIENPILLLLRRFPPGVCQLKSLTHLHLNDVQLEDLPVDIGGCVDSIFM